MAGKEIQPRIYCWKISIDRLTVYTASTEKGAARVGLSLKNMGAPADYFRSIFFEAKLAENREINKALIEAIEESLRGLITETFTKDIDCTPFQKTVLKKIAEIPFGETRTYGDIAKMIGKPGAARAIGQVMNKNPLPLIYPCHRVVAASGFGGFRGGVDIKKYLLKREKELKQ